MTEFTGNTNAKKDILWCINKCQDEHVRIVEDLEGFAERVAIKTESGIHLDTARLQAYEEME